MSDKIQLIIWSRDRACQTETLLDSIGVYAKDIFDIDLIYSFSNQEYLTGYRRLFVNYHEKIRFHNKQDGQGKKLLLETLNSNENKVMCFTTEDTILHSLVKKSPSAFMDDCDIFSLRLGSNTIVQNHVTGEKQPVLTNYDFEFYGPKEDLAVVWNWNFLNYHPHCNYGYPFGLDMVCYTKHMMIPLIEKCNFDKPNELESQLFKFRSNINPKIKCFDQSCAVNVPITNMSTITKSEGVSLEILNTQYLGGKKLRYKFDKPIIGCHQVLDYEFTM